MSRTVPFSTASAHLSELADAVEGNGERVVVTRAGRSSFVMMSPDELESLEETIQVLGNRELVRSVRRSQREAATGERVRLRDLA